jgi:hypothetical protein
MRLTGAGHGTVFDLEVIDGQTFVWLSWARDAAGHVINDLVRFPYVPGVTMDRSHPSIAAYSKLGGGYLNVMFDWRHDLVAVRDSWAGVDNYTLRWASDFKEGRDDPLAHIRLPQGPPSMQGFCTVNRHLYRLTGTSNGSDPRLLTRYDWRTGEAVPVSMEGAGPAVDGFMEPEGVSLHRDPDGCAVAAGGDGHGPPSAPIVERVGVARLVRAGRASSAAYACDGACRPPGRHRTAPTVRTPSRLVGVVPRAHSGDVDGPFGGADDDLGCVRESHPGCGPVEG